TIGKLNSQKLDRSDHRTESKTEREEIKQRFGEGRDKSIGKALSVNVEVSQPHAADGAEGRHEPLPFPRCVPVSFRYTSSKFDGRFHRTPGRISSSTICSAMCSAINS